ncbi:phosphate acyltransferase PlsX [Peptoclostridium acidaminophilum DSM 3953]|uniref:Phosphate acyltransferase n=1 Tax=Peptoclostridium acidaminophilum DSM 3953 TaxID=1286171 RepID=W8TF79_PEPAC|nr:phosphate acyltransferase PlsX [Peptoclostridium acidaminophilum]AHM56483.1 phosphate acyltransferase PlsX [Peptoclostridium acidaminophilum DSM 3953]
MKIAIDGMGGDHAPFSTVKGIVDAINEYNAEIVVTGDKTVLENEFAKYSFDKGNLEIIHTTQVVTNDDKPVKAVKGKKDSSMMVALELVKNNKADAAVSAGNTGALLAGGLLNIGRIAGVDRPALCTALPSKKGFTLLLDAGANADCKPINIVQFGIMGSIYARQVLDVKNPTVGLVNVGSEEGKGNELTKAAYELLKEEKLINFTGNIEARDIPEGKADVVVCDGFTGNVILKLIEGVADFLMGKLKNVFMSGLISKLAALLVKDGLKQMKSELDYSEYGGAPFVGVDGALIKAHGSSDAKAIKNAIGYAMKYVEGDVVGEIKNSIKGE